MLTKIKYYLVGALGFIGIALKLLLDKKSAELEVSQQKERIAEASNKFYQRKTRAEEALERKQLKEAKDREQSFKDGKRNQLDNDW